MKEGFLGLPQRLLLHLWLGQGAESAVPASSCSCQVGQPGVDLLPRGKILELILYLYGFFSKRDKRVTSCS